MSPVASALRREAGECLLCVTHGLPEGAGEGEAVDGLHRFGLGRGEAEADGRGLLTAGEDGVGEGAGGGGVGHMFCVVQLGQ